MALDEFEKMEYKGMYPVRPKGHPYQGVKGIKFFNR
jgi:hypothetical protein